MLRMRALVSGDLPSINVLADCSRWQYDRRKPFISILLAANGFSVLTSYKQVGLISNFFVPPVGAI